MSAALALTPLARVASLVAVKTTAEQGRRRRFGWRVQAATVDGRRADVAGDEGEHLPVVAQRALARLHLVVLP